MFIFDYFCPAGSTHIILNPWWVVQPLIRYAQAPAKCIKMDRNGSFAQCTRQIWTSFGMIIQWVFSVRFCMPVFPRPKGGSGPGRAAIWGDADGETGLGSVPKTWDFSRASSPWDGHWSCKFDVWTHPGMVFLSKHLRSCEKHGLLNGPLTWLILLLILINPNQLMVCLDQT